MPKIKCLFIINPISGLGNKLKIPNLISKYIEEKKFSYEIVFTEYAGHAIQISEEAVATGFDRIIAVGGDGTINETAASLVNKEVNFGVVPIGSGNGFARHWHISLNPRIAITQLNTAEVHPIDAATLNGKLFFNVSGVGFDGQVSRLFAAQKQRGYLNYIRIVLNELNRYKPGKFRLNINNQWIEEEYFLVAFANTTQYGNNAVIAPQACCDDGLLDVILLKKFPLTEFPILTIQAASKQIHRSKYVTTLKVKHFEVELLDDTPVHIDGEFWETERKLNVNIIPHSLKMLVPRQSRR